MKALLPLSLIKMNRELKDALKIIASHCLVSQLAGVAFGLFGEPYAHLGSMPAVDVILMPVLVIFKMVSVVEWFLEPAQWINYFTLLWSYILPMAVLLSLILRRPRGLYRYLGMRDNN